METPVSEIQEESKDEKRSAEVTLQDERQKEKASMLCFKRRKKPAKAMTPKAGSEAADVARKCPSEAGASDHPQPPRGAWASIKRLVTSRKRSGSSKQQKPFEAKVQPEINTEDADLSKKKAKSRLRIPCIKFSKGEKRRNRSKITEDADCSTKVQGEAARLYTKTPTQSDHQETKPKLTQEESGDALQKGAEDVCESNVSNSRTSGKKVISVELGLDTGHPAAQTGTLILEKDTEPTEEKQSVQPQQTSPLEPLVLEKDTEPTEQKQSIQTQQTSSLDILILEKDIEKTEEKQTIQTQQTSSLEILILERDTEETEEKQTMETQQASSLEILILEKDIEETEEKQTIQTQQASSLEILILEKDIEETEEKQTIQPQQTSLLETSETEHQLPVVSEASHSPAVPDQQIVEEARNNILESEPNWKDHRSGETVAEEVTPKDIELSQESDFKEGEISIEKPKPEESKIMEPIAIIITDTEISEFDVKESKNVPKQLLLSSENEEVGGFAECGFEGRTSEQYETLLIETASSLVKNAIQLSIEQLVNEMASGDNKINNLLQ